MAVGGTREEAEGFGMETWMSSVWEGSTVEPCNAHLTNTNSTTLSKEYKSLFSFQ